MSLFKKKSEDINLDSRFQFHLEMLDMEEALRKRAALSEHAFSAKNNAERAFIMPLGVVIDKEAFEGKAFPISGDFLRMRRK